MHLYQDGDRVCLQLGAERREILLSLEIAGIAADDLERYAAKAATAKQIGFRDRDPSIAVESIITKGKPLVRIRFGAWTGKAFLTPPHAFNLAAIIRVAIRQAEKHLRWIEERDPACLLR
jgi:hypothetical protein